MLQEFFFLGKAEGHIVSLFTKRLKINETALYAVTCQKHINPAFVICL